ncbi:FRG domain-containing protein [Pseudoalteromonas sp. P1-11]|uniref:FRG domain-containing protein n=1 Tax=Pseudoalteromonas sp. P1-11 TaxID=1715254 RepID=UPI0006DC130F|nr:FRG domain-containing protein [Pseudoalteromonas sp. P1-11]KPW03340.1 FRG domain protein [Pseudoalteromonas sp. P1-11]
MDGRKKWEEAPLIKGIKEYELSHWKHFSDFINKEMLDYTTYVYRGHSCYKWKLEPTLDRFIKDPESYHREEHLNKFMYETRGRRGANPTKIDNDNDWWALGQHHGLYTPLLDWTESPFVSLFFAANNASSEKSKYIAVYALSQSSIDEKNELIKADDKVKKINGHKPTVKLVRPLTDENNRLVSQRGLFTRGPNNMDIESWVEKFQTENSDTHYELIKIKIPKKGLEACLRYLNRMNISHSTLFPDLSGASDFCNTHLTIDKY